MKSKLKLLFGKFMGLLGIVLDKVGLFTILLSMKSFKISKKFIKLGRK